MGVIKGLAFFFLVMCPGFILFAIIAGGGAWVLLTATGAAVTGGLEFIGVPSGDTDVVIATAVVAFFAYLVALALSRDFRSL